MNFIKTKYFCSAIDNIKRIRRQFTDWEKIFVQTHLIKKGLLFTRYKELLELNNKKTAQLKVDKRAEQTLRSIYLVAKEMPPWQEHVKNLQHRVSFGNCKGNKDEIPLYTY